MSFTADRLETPGTARLFDSTGQALSNHIHLIPAPSSSPEDPLNWTQARKYFHLFCILLYTIATCVLSSVLYSVYTPLGEDNGLTLDQLNAGQGYMYLFIGLVCLFTQPLALAFGKKPMYIASSLATGFVNLWVIYGKGNGQWIACRLLLGLALSPQFTLVEVSIADVFFMHERAYGLGLYCTSLYVGVTLGPLLSGYINDGLGWHAIIWLSSGFCWLTAFFLFFFLEESSFIRDSATEQLANQDHAGPVVAGRSSSHDQDKKTELPPIDQNEALEVIDPTTQMTRTPWPGPRFWRYASPHPYASGIMLRGIVQPLMLLRSPIILWCSLQFGMYQVYYNMIAAMTSGVLAEPPYNFSAASVGLTFVGPLLASIPGSILGGRLADAYAVRRARANGGVSEAEHKLHLFAVPLVGMVVGLLMMGLGPAYEAHWIVFVLGTSIVNFMGPIATLLALAYAFDCFHSIRPENQEGPQAATQDAAPYLLTVILVGMTIAFGFGYAITPWCFEWGFRNFGLSAGLSSILVNATAYLIIWRGRSLRRGGEAYCRKVVNW